MLAHRAERGKRIVDRGGKLVLRRQAIVDGHDQTSRAQRHQRAEHVARLETADHAPAHVEIDQRRHQPVRQTRLVRPCRDRASARPRQQNVGDLDVVLGRRRRAAPSPAAAALRASHRRQRWQAAADALPSQPRTASRGSSVRPSIVSFLPPDKATSQPPGKLNNVRDQTSSACARKMRPAAHQVKPERSGVSTRDSVLTSRQPAIEGTAQMSRYDFVIRNGTIFDGTGATGLRRRRRRPRRPHRRRSAASPAPAAKKSTPKARSSPRASSTSTPTTTAKRPGTNA